MKAGISKINDKLRKEMSVAKIQINLSDEVARSPDRAAIIKAIKEFDDFMDEIDTTGDHSIGLVDVKNEKYLFKYDYLDDRYDYSTETGKRLLKIMNAKEFRSSRVTPTLRKLINNASATKKNKKQVMNKTTNKTTKKSTKKIKKQIKTTTKTTDINKKHKKMPVGSSNLALRFYCADGWNKELLDSLTIKGECIYREMSFGDENMDYFMPIIGTELDVDKLMEYVSRVDRAFDDIPEQTDREFIESKLH